VPFTNTLPILCERRTEFKYKKHINHIFKQFFQQVQRISSKIKLLTATRFISSVIKSFPKLKKNEIFQVRYH
jgi:hypothetical protein